MATVTCSTPGGTKVSLWNIRHTVAEPTVRFSPSLLAKCAKCLLTTKEIHVYNGKVIKRKKEVNYKSDKNRLKGAYCFSVFMEPIFYYRASPVIWNHATLLSMHRSQQMALVWLIRAMEYLLAANHGSSCSLTRAIDGRIVRCGIISWC